MTVGNILKLVDETKPNSFSEMVKTIWLSELEARIHNDVLRHTEPFTSLEAGEFERELLAREPHTAVYRWWLYAMIDHAAEDYEKYQNDMQLFNAAWEDYEGWYLRTHPVGRSAGCSCTVNREWGDPLCQS